MNHTVQAAREREYRPDVDGLRAVAILSVVLFHAGVPFLGGGFTGVDIFFVISGYLIGGHIHADLARGTFSYLKFYQRRAKRILPALYAVLAVLLVIGYFLFAPFEFLKLSEYTMAAATSSSNILLWLKESYFNPQAESNPLLMTWSLGVEEQFYILIPMLMVLLSRIRQRLVLPLIGVVIVVSFTLSWLQLGAHPTAVFYSLHSRAWELAAGVALAMLESRARQLPLHKPGVSSNLLAGTGVLFLLVSFFAIQATTPFPGPAALPSVLGGAMLVAAGGSWVNRNVLSLAPVVFIGRISYSWYLWHWPLFALLRMLGGDVFPLSWGLCAALASFGLAVLSYYFIERPFRASKRAPLPLLMSYGAVSAALLAVCLIIYKSNGIERRSPVLASIDKITLDLDIDPCIVDEGAVAPNLSSYCAGDPANQNKVAVWGDSHASAMASTLRIRAREQGYFLQEFAKKRCPPLLGASRNVSFYPQHIQQCIAYNNFVLRRLIADPTTKIIVLEASWSVSFNPLENSDQLVPDQGLVLANPSQERSNQVLEKSLRETLKALRAANKQVIVLGDVPFFAVNPVWRFRTGQNAARLKLFEILRGFSEPADPGRGTVRDNTPEGRQARQILMRTALSVPGVTFWDPRRQMCVSLDSCFYREGDISYFIDDNHVTPLGAIKALEGWSLPKAQ
jgi:peptidoglycan/LPS O-acetylase OafA/YrhL